MTKRMCVIVVPKDRREGGSYRAQMSAFENALLSHADLVCAVSVEIMYRDARGSIKSQRATEFRILVDDEAFTQLADTACTLFPREEIMFGDSYHESSTDADGS